MTKECKLCGNTFEKDLRTSRRHFIEKTVYCSRACLDKTKIGNTYRRGQKHPNIWNKGKKGLQVAWNKGNGEYAKALGFGKWMVGKQPSIETRRKISETHKARVARGENNFYIDGRTPQRKAIRRSLDYRLWREAVFKRDNWTCTECKERGVYLEAHHIKPFAFFPELRFAIDNGISVCTPCHAKIDIYRKRTMSKTH